MKKKYRKQTIFLLALILPLYGISILISFFSSAAFASNEAKWINGVYRIKTKLAQSITKPKIVFVGGSNVHFGINTPLASRELKTSCVNLGSHSGLGLAFIIYKAKKILNSGDTVVLAMEYEAYSEGGQITSLAKDYSIAFEKDFLYQSSLKHQIQAFLSVKGILSGILQYGFSSSEVPSEGAPFYHSSSVNKYGDETNNEYCLRALSFNNSFQDRVIKNSKGLHYLKKFAEWCSINEIELFLSWPPVPKPLGQLSLKYIETAKEELARQKFKVLGVPNQFFFDKDEFYDTSYHLNIEGAKKRTLLLIQMLDNYQSAKEGSILYHR